MQRNLPTVNGPFPVVQAALDFLDTKRALGVARQAREGGINWLEAGTPLIKSEGLNSIRALRAEFPDAVIIADMKTMDAGRAEVESAAKAGASVVVCLAAASDATISQCVEAGKNYGVKIYCDTIGLENPEIRATEIEKLGVDFIGVHCPIDEQMQGKNPLDKLRKVVAAVSVPVGVAGGINSETAGEIAKIGGSIIIVGGALHKAPDAVKAAQDLNNAVQSGEAISSNIGHRASEESIRDTLLKVSASNLSDALNHQPGIRGIEFRLKGRHLRMVGQATTVKTVAGDWNKVVQAIDIAGKNGVVVADCGGTPPAVWGELATLSAKKVGLAGAVINGAIRDTDVALELGMPLFSACVSPDAGDPKGHGEINCDITIGGQTIHPGDWIVGDDDGIMVLPKGKALEYANRALDVLEAENRLRSEIEAGSTLSAVVDLSKWEKK